MATDYAELMIEKVAADERCALYQNILDVVIKQRDERMRLLHKARDFIVAHMEQCDAQCGTEEAATLIEKINNMIAD